MGHVFFFLILWSLKKKSMFNGFLFSLYLIGYGFVRFFIEFVRQPDDHLGFIVGPFTMGQILCFAMIFAGLLLFFLKKNRKSTSK
jgi:phosphatidylglycerol:prolipoprotein diacylglycerol transferase